MTIRDIAVAFGFEVDKNSEKQAQNSIQGMKNMATKLLGAIGIGFSIAGLSSLAQAAADVEALKSQFSQVFGEMESDASSKLDAIAEDTGVAVNRMKGSFTQIAAFSKTTGLDQAQSLEIADRSMKAVTDSAAFYDRSIEDVTESMRSFLKGNFEQDAALGLSATETTRNTAANKLYGKSFKDLSEAEKQFTLLSMVEDANKASGALGQAARESDTWTNQLGNLKQNLQDLKAAVGTGFLKPAVAVLKMLSGMTKALTDKIQVLTAEDGALARTFEEIHATVKQLKPAIDRMMQTLSNGFSAIMNVVKKVVDRLGGIENVLKIAAIAASAFFAVLKVMKIMAFIKNAEKMAALMLKLKKIFSLNTLMILKYIAVIVILALIIEDFVHFMLGNDSVIGTFFDKAGIGADNARQTIIDAWGKIKDFLLNVWDFIKQAAGMFVDTLKGFFDKHGESILQNFTRAWGIIKTFLKGVWTFISQLASTLFGGTESNIDGSTKSTKDNLLAVWGAILEALSTVWDTLYELGSAVFNALATVIEVVFGLIKAFWNKWGSDVLSWFKMLWDGLGGILNGFLQIIKGISNFISSVFTGDWQGAWEAVQQIFTGVWNAISSFLTAIWGIITGIISTAINVAYTAIVSVLQAIYNFFSSIFSSIASYVSSIFSNILSSITSKISSIKTSIVNGLQAAVSYIKSLPAQAVKWGADFVDGLKRGIVSKIQSVIDSVKGLAGKIKSFLHFSVPDEGPLTDYESWMPDFMEGLAKGISKNEDVVLDKVRNLTSGIAALTKAATAKASTANTSTVNNTTSSVVQNVNIDNSYNGGSMETQQNVSKAMKKSATDATTQMARALAFARG